MEDAQQQATNTLFKVLGAMFNLDETTLKSEDSLLDDLLLDSNDIQRLISATSQELHITIDPEAVDEFLESIETNSAEATIGRLAVVIAEELDLN